MNDSSSHYDIIIIGSGIGALTVASVMTQMRGKRVLVLEKHFQPGGYTQDFKRGPYTFDTGLHYVARVGKRGLYRALLDLITNDMVDFVPMADPYETFVYPDFKFDVPAGKARYRARLIAAFPDEKPAIKRFFKDSGRAAAGVAMNIHLNSASRLGRGIARASRWIMRTDDSITTGQYLDRHVKNPKLKALLASQWGDLGLPPGLCSFGYHSMTMNFYLAGGHFPVGGSGTLARSVKKIVEDGGGTVLLRREVSEILLKDGKAVGVKARRISGSGDGEEEEYFAPTIVSNAGAFNTYFELLPRTVPIPFRDDLARFVETHPPSSNLTLFVGLSKDPRELGFKGANHWLYDGLDHDRTFAQRGDWLDQGQPGHLCLSFHSLKEPGAKAHSMELITFTDYRRFSRWAKLPCGKRGDDYQQFKNRIADGMLAFVDRYYPGFSDIVAFKELGTPLTNESYTNHKGGAAYGIGAYVERYLRDNAAWTHPVTPVPGLFLTGADAAGLGVPGAIFGGLTCMGHLPDGVLLPAVMKHARKRPTAGRSARADLHPVSND